MKFSEQVVLGSTLVKFDPKLYLDEGCGCLIGMAGASVGLSSFGGYPLSTVRERWPWLMERRIIPCPKCATRHNCYAMSVSCVAAHVGMEDMTLEQALDYIRSIEPDEVDAPDTTFPVWNRDMVPA